MVQSYLIVGGGLNYFFNNTAVSGKGGRGGSRIFRGGGPGANFL